MDIWDVEVSLNNLILGIKADKDRAAKAKNELIAFADRVDSTPTRYSELIAAIDALPSGDANNDVLKAKLAGITTGYVPLRTALNSASAGLQAITEF